MKKYLQLAALLVAICVLLVMLLSTSITGENMLDAIGASLGAVLHRIVSFLVFKIPIPIWAFPLLLLLVPLALFVFTWASERRRRWIEDKHGFRKNYVSDEFRGVRYRWRYFSDYVGKITPYCPDCEEPLKKPDPDARSMSVTCDHCQRRFVLMRPLEIREAVRRNATQLYGNVSIDTLKVLSRNHMW